VAGGDVGDPAGLATRVGDRRADVPRLEERELLAVLLDERREAPEEARPVGGRDGAPGRGGGTRGGDGGVRLLDAGRLQLGDGLLGGGIDDGEGHARFSSSRDTREPRL